MSSLSTFSQQCTPSSYYFSEFKPILSGSLQTKCSDGYFYQHHYNLTSHRLIQYQCQKLKKMILCIDFRTVELKSFHRSQCYIKIAFNQSKLILKAESQEQANRWAEQLSKIIGNCANQLCVLEQTIRFSEIVITFSQLLRFSDTFDILLFKSTNKTAGLQRFLTGSIYDHIGLLLVSQSGEIYMIEVNSKTGVCLLNQESLKRKIANSVKVGYRKLMDGKKGEEVHKLEQSLGQLLACKYEFGLGKLFGGDKENCGGVKKTYFCSELVAEILKKCGLLKSKRESSRYWPGDFQKEGKVDNMEFGQIMSVVK